MFLLSHYYTVGGPPKVSLTLWQACTGVRAINLPLWAILVPIAARADTFREP